MWLLLNSMEWRLSLQVQNRKRIGLTALGEILIDFTACGVSSNGVRLFSQNPGGAPANVAVAAARLGIPSAFIGRCGADMHGFFLQETLRAAGVDISGLSLDSEHFTTLSFVELEENGERQFAFCRNGTADTQLRPENVPSDLLKETSILCVGSMSLSTEPMRSTQLSCIKTAKQAGALVAFDPNYRVAVWPEARRFQENITPLLRGADLVKISAEEVELVTGERSPDNALDYLLRQGASVAVVTLGSHGAVATSRMGRVRCSGLTCRPVDATGAGDAFWAGFLCALLSEETPAGELSVQELERCICFANGMGAYCVSHFGAIGGMPTQKQLDDFLEQFK